MSMKVAPARDAEECDVIGYALDGWGRTARLCAIQICRAAPAVFTWVAWLVMRGNGCPGPVAPERWAPAAWVRLPRFPDVSSLASCQLLTR
jgi:hypothetical protein